MTPVDVSLERGTKNEAEPKPMGASIKGGDEKEYSATPLDVGELLSLAKEDKKNPEAPADAIVPSLFVELESKGEDKVPAEGDKKYLSAQEEKMQKQWRSQLPCYILWRERTEVLKLLLRPPRKVKPGDLKAARSKYMKKKKGALLSNNNGGSPNEQDIKASTSGDKNLPENLSEVKAA